MPSTPSKKQCKQSRNLILEKALLAVTVIFKKRIQNNDISKIINMERPDISLHWKKKHGPSFVWLLIIFLETIHLLPMRALLITINRHKNLGARMSQKILFVYLHLDFFFPNMGKVSDEHGDGFH